MLRTVWGGEKEGEERRGRKATNSAYHHPLRVLCVPQRRFQLFLQGRITGIIPLHPTNAYPVFARNRAQDQSQQPLPSVRSTCLHFEPHSHYRPISREKAPVAVCLRAGTISDTI